MSMGELLRQLIAEERIDTVVVAFADLQGRPVGKRVTTDFYLEHVAHHGIDVCDYLLGVDVDLTPLPGYRFTNWDTGYGDLTVVPDERTTRILPWVEGTALVLGDVFDRHGAPVKVSPRRILERQVARAAERGLEVRCATELEFYLFKESPEEAAAKGWRDMTPHSDSIQDYQLLQTAGQEYIVRRIRNEMGAAGIPIEFSKGEAGRGQHEVNVTYADPLETADRHLVFKNGVKEIAAQMGRTATFMAKWSMAEVGSSCHVHTSLWDAGSGEPLMWDAAAPTHLSTPARHFLAGQLHAARQLAWCAAPYVNSYKRYLPDSWAPTAVAWGEDNRTCGFRVLGRGAGRRIESRVPGADVNPYLTLAAAIAAGLYGIDHQLDPGEPYPSNAYEAPDVARLPSTLAEAIGEFAHSAVAAEAFGDEVHHHLLNTARQEWATANRVVTDWELERNFERI
jgi:glutamine synthetase